MKSERSIIPGINIQDMYNYCRLTAKTVFHRVNKLSDEELYAWLQKHDLTNETNMAHFCKYYALDLDTMKNKLHELQNMYGL